VGEEEGEGHPNTPELAVIVGVTPEGGEVLEAVPRAVVPRQLQEDACTAWRALLGGVALAGSVGVGDVVVVGILASLLLPKARAWRFCLSVRLPALPYGEGPRRAGSGGMLVWPDVCHRGGA